jgi:hypothetical protein
MVADTVADMAAVMVADTARSQLPEWNARLPPSAAAKFRYKYNSAKLQSAWVELTVLAGTCFQATELSTGIMDTNTLGKDEDHGATHNYSCNCHNSCSWRLRDYPLGPQFQ